MVPRVSPCPPWSEAPQSFFFFFFLSALSIFLSSFLDFFFAFFLAFFTFFVRPFTLAFLAAFFAAFFESFFFGPAFLYMLWHFLYAPFSSAWHLSSSATWV